MPRNYPPHPDYTDPSFGAEKRVWQELQALPDNAVVIAQYRIRDRRVTREADLIVIVPDVGLGVLEVKGGRVFSQDHEWYSVDRHGQTHVIKSPMWQADQVGYLLRRFVAGQGGTWPGHVPVVVMPDTRSLNGFVPADSRREQWIEGAENIVQRVLTAITLERPPSQSGVDELIEILEQRLPRPPARELALMGAEQAEMVTRDQYAILRAVRINDRILVTGGPGTGKTWLALEHARQESALGARVALLCYNRGLAVHMAERARSWPESERPAYLGTLHQLALDWTGTSVPEQADTRFWAALPASLAQSAAKHQRFDLVIVDEAQDFDEAWWPHVLSLLEDPETGPMVVFGDEGQALYARSALSGLPTMEVGLTENVRNTDQIAALLEALTGEPVSTRGASGPPAMFLPTPGEGVEDVATQAVEALMADGQYGAGDIALLTTFRRHPEQTRRQEALGPVDFAKTLLAEDQTAVSTVKGFKGLERPAVVLAVNGFHADDDPRALLLVGISRATHQVVVVGDPAELQDVAGEQFLAALA